MKSTVTINILDDYELILKNQLGFSCSGNEQNKKWTVPDELGSGYIEIMYPCDDVSIHIINLNLEHPLVMRYEDYSSKFEMTHCFNGSIVYSETGVIDTNLGRDEFAIFTKPHSRGVTMFPTGKDILAVSLIAKNQFFDHLPYRAEYIASETYDGIELANSLMKPRKASVQFSNLFRQFMGGIASPDLQSYFFEGAAKVTLSMLWQDYIINPLKGSFSHNLSPADQKAIRRAWDVLNQRYADPPTIPELAKIAAINEYKLKNGFREMYSKTIYEYVRELKMKNARTLLENRDLSISQIAYEVGYVNTSHFARAFRNEFGINPRDLRFGV